MIRKNERKTKIFMDQRYKTTMGVMGMRKVEWIDKKEWKEDQNIYGSKK